MGLKFKGKTTTGVPIDGSIGERELHINTVDFDIYSSTDGTDVIKLGGSSMPEKGGILWNIATAYVVGDIVSENDVMYTSRTINTGVQPSTDVSSVDWIKVSIDLDQKIYFAGGM